MCPGQRSSGPQHDPSQTHALALRPKTSTSTTDSTNTAGLMNIDLILNSRSSTVGEVAGPAPPLSQPATSGVSSSPPASVEPVPPTEFTVEANMMSRAFRSEKWLARGSEPKSTTKAVHAAQIPKGNAWPPALLTPSAPTHGRRPSLFPSDDAEDCDNDNDESSTTTGSPMGSVHDGDYDGDSESSSPVFESSSSAIAPTRSCRGSSPRTTLVSSIFDSFLGRLHGRETNSPNPASSYSFLNSPTGSSISLSPTYPTPPLPFPVPPFPSALYEYAGSPRSSSFLSAMEYQASSLVSPIFLVGKEMELVPSCPIPPLPFPVPPFPPAPYEMMAGRGDVDEVEDENRGMRGRGFRWWL